MQSTGIIWIIWVIWAKEVTWFIWVIWVIQVIFVLRVIEALRVIWVTWDYMGLCTLHELQVNFGSVQKCISLNHLGKFLPNFLAIPSLQSWMSLLQGKHCPIFMLWVHYEKWLYIPIVLRFQFVTAVHCCCHCFLPQKNSGNSCCSLPLS